MGQLLGGGLWCKGDIVIITYSDICTYMQLPSKQNAKLELHLKLQLKETVSAEDAKEIAVIDTKNTAAV